MKLVLGLFLFATASCLALDITTLDGVTYRNVRVTRVEADGISILHSGGGEKLPFLNLPEDIRKKYSYDPAKAAAAKKAAASGWQEMDQRLVFFTVQLGSVEASLNALNRALVRLGIQQTVRERDANTARDANTTMDRYGGGPVPWDQFYGRTAEKFFYHPTDSRTSYHTLTILGQRPPSWDNATSQGVPSRQGLPVHQRPPQFDYIYRANTDAEKRAQAEVAKLGNNAEAILQRRRQLEAEQSALWSKIAFHAITSRELLTKPLYFHDLKNADADTAEARQRLEALRAAMDYLRSGNKLASVVEEGVDGDAPGCYSQLQKGMQTARAEMERRLMSQPTVSGEMTDRQTTLGKLSAVAKRMNEITANITDAYCLALDGDKSGGQGRKLTFRSQLQQSLMLCAEALLAGDECVTDLARDWKLAPATQITAPAASAAVQSSLVAPSPKPLETPTPVTSMANTAGAVITISTRDAVRIRPLEVGQPRLYDSSPLRIIEGVSQELSNWQFVSIPQRIINSYEIHVNQDGILYAFGGKKNIQSQKFIGVEEASKWEEASGAIRGINVNHCLRRKVTAGEIIRLSAFELQFAAKSIELARDGKVESATQPPASAPQSSTQPGEPWTNSLGMKFVPVPGTKVLFSIWDTRVQDYQAFVSATGRQWQKPSFEQGPTHPAVMLSCDDARAFCAWLTKTERSAGTLNATQEYRLPMDLEWSAAVGLEHETGNTPEERHRKRIRGVYPWGMQWPPPRGAGNYDQSLKVDDFDKTSPVGSFVANQFGLYDMGGNVRQYCEEDHVLRGSSYNGAKDSDLWSSGRSPRSDNKRFLDVGFRCVLAGGAASR